MRSSSLRVYSPVEYTGYKEKRSGHPSEPGSRTGNRKTTRKPKPILYRLRRFCKRLNWKGIGGLAVTTVVIVFAVRGVVGMFSEHTQTKTAPITTSSPAAEESQPYVFYYKDGQAVSWEDVTDAWAAEAGIQKRYALTDAERLEIAQVLTAEAGGEPFAGKIAVAQCILQTCEDEGIRPDEVLRVYAYSKRRPEPTQEALEAVQDVFDFGIVATTEPIKYFYAPALTDSEWHESQIYVMTINGHRFFKEATKWLDKVVDVDSGEVIQAGTDQSAAHFNNMESGITDASVAAAMLLIAAGELQSQTEIERHVVELKNTASYPFNNSTKTVSLAITRDNTDYTVDVDIQAHTGNVGEIQIYDKQLNGFKVKYDGSAESATLILRIKGGK